MSTNNYTGTVTGGRRTRATTRAPVVHESTIEWDDDRRPAVGSRVTANLLLSDEAIGKRLREMLTKNIERRTVMDFATDVEDSVGWPILADLIRDIVLGEDDDA